MIVFPLSALGKNTADKAAYKQLIESCAPDELPLQQGLVLSSRVADKPFEAMIINHSEEEGFIYLKVGIFYTGIIAGCSCADDPSPMDEQVEYCVLQFVIDQQSGDARVSLLSD